MVNKFLLIAIVTLIIASLLVSCGSKNVDNNNVAEGADSSEVGSSKGEDALPDGSSDESQSDSTDKSDEITDNVGGDDDQTDDNVNGDNIPEDDGKNEQTPEDSGDGDKLPEDSGDGEQILEENNPVLNIPFGTTVGYRFNDVVLQTLDGSYVNTADLRGKVIIFNVWATWCPPCKEELPDFNEVSSEYADDVVIIAAHTYGSGASNMPSYVASNFPGTKIIFAYDDASDSAYIAAGGIGYVPQTAIIDRDGIIRYSDSGILSHAALTSWIEILTV